MIRKQLAIAAAIFVLSGLTAVQAVAQTGAAAPAAPAMAAPAALRARRPQPPRRRLPLPRRLPSPRPNRPTPTALPSFGPARAASPTWVARGVMIILAIMSIGTWYIFFMKYWEQSRVLGQARPGREALLVVEQPQ